MRVHLLFLFVLVLLCCTTARRNGGGRRGGRNGGGRRGGGRGGGGRGGGGRGGGGGSGDGGTCGGQLAALRAAFPEGLWIDSETCLDSFFTIGFMQNNWIFFWYDGLHACTKGWKSFYMRVEEKIIWPNYLRWFLSTSDYNQSSINKKPINDQNNQTQTIPIKLLSMMFGKTWKTTA